MHTVPRRRLLAATIAAGAVLLTTACGAGSSSTVTSPSSTGSAQPVTLRFFTFSAVPDHPKDLDKIVAAFEVENPTIKIKVETAPYDQYFTKLQTTVAGDTAPDTFELNYENFVTYADSGTLLELPGDSYDPATYATESLKMFTSDGKQLGLPESFSDVVLIYNKDLFDKAGVAAPTADWTWADEQAAAQKLTDKAKGVFGDYQPPQFYEFYKADQQAGGKFFGADGKATFNDAAGARALTWLVSKVGKTMPTAADGVGTPDYDTKLFEAGKLAMWHNGIWQFGGLTDKAKFNWDIVVEPGDSQKASAVFQNGVVASAATQHPAEAAKWLNYLASSDVTVATRLASSWELPAIADTAKLQPYLAVTPPQNKQAVFDSLDAIAIEPVITDQQAMVDAINKEIDNAAAGRKPVQQALDDAAAAVNKLIG
jgi:multiple sugar transport system substrate-binding protein